MSGLQTVRTLPTSFGSGLPNQDTLPDAGVSRASCVKITARSRMDVDRQHGKALLSRVVMCPDAD